MEDSENSSGCESGWTLYLEHSHSPQNHINEEDDFICKRGSSSTQHEIEIEEDMSMVSDASSGPQHFAEEEEEEEEEECYKFSNNGGGVYSSGGKRRKTRNEEEMIHHQMPMGPSFLDDTASSPFSFSFSNKTMPTKKAAVSVAEDEMIECSQGYSTTYTYYCCYNHKNVYEQCNKQMVGTWKGRGGRDHVTGNSDPIFSANCNEKLKTNNPRI